MSDPLLSIFDIGASAMSAQNIRLNTIASNMANTNSISGSPQSTFQAMKVIFGTHFGDEGAAGVHIQDIVSLNREPIREFAPDHPLADAGGFIYKPNINVLEELTDSMHASRAFEVSATLMDTSKRMIEKLLKLGE